MRSLEQHANDGFCVKILNCLGVVLVILHVVYVVLITKLKNATDFILLTLQ